MRCRGLWLPIIAGVAFAGGLRGQEQVWRQLRDAGQAALDRGDLPAAERQWVAAYNEARVLGVQTLRFAESQRNLAEIYTMMWRFDEAGAMLRDAATLMKTAGQAPASDWEMRFAAGRLEMAKSNLPQADQELDFAAQNVSRNFGADHPKTAIVLSTLGALRLQEYAFTDSTKNLRLAEGILAETYGPNHVATVQAQLRYAQALLASGRYSDATEKARVAVDTAQQLGSAGRLVRGDALLALGLIYAAAGRTQEALGSFEQALTATAEAFGAQGLRILPCLAALAEVSLTTSDTTRASELLNRAKAAYESNPIPDWLPFARVLWVQAKAAIQSRKPSEADSAIQQAIDIATKRLGPDSIFLADLLEIRGDLRLASGEVDKADQEYRRAMIARERRLPATHPDLAKSMVDIARVYQNRGEPDLAEELYKKALQTLESEWGNDSFSLIPTLESYESFLRLQKRNEEAGAVKERIARLQRARQR